jgi:hypothetical protein
MMAVPPCSGRRVLPLPRIRPPWFDLAVLPQARRALFGMVSDGIGAAMLSSHWPFQHTCTGESRKLADRGRHGK